MGKSLDERAAEIARSQDFGDIRIPLDIAARLQKSKRVEKKDTVDGVDLDKIHAQKDADKEDGDDTEKKKDDEKPEPSEEDAEKSFRRVETETLQKSRLLRLARQPDPFFVKVGRWVSESLVKSDVDTIRKAVAAALPDYQHEAKGKTLVAGLPEPKAVSDTHGDAKIVAINTEIMGLQERMRCEGSDPYDNSVIFNRLRECYEKLAEAIMNSMGLGQQTEDLIPEDPCAEKPAAMVSVHKSQAEPVVVPENTGAEVVVSE